MQREWAQKRVAGARTFPLITVFGALAAMLAERFGGWEIAAGFLALASMIILGNLAKFRGGVPDPGITTEIAALVMFAVGATLVAGSTAVAVAVGGGVAALLQWKRPLHEFINNLSETDVRAVVRLVVIGLVILPILPNETYGPYDVVNPFKIWLMVVLIVGISLAAYVCYKVLGEKVGMFLAGLLGGLISSTATTVSYARRTREQPRTASVSAVVIIIASTIVFVRVIFEIALVAPETLPATAPPLLAMTGYMALISAGAFFLAERKGGTPPDHASPSSLTAAIVFGLLFAVVLFGVAAAKEHFGEAGLYTVASLSGLTDMDAITLSSAEMIQSGRIDADTGWRLILVGALSNVFLKGCAVAVLGTPKLLGYIAAIFGLTIVGGVALFIAWP
ncbi:MAG: MgtC/SapB family protein [Verrucomicrobiae bacterium]|nr:MgtC/SapB family protein [Verrucomicrobiae bacterium]